MFINENNLKKKKKQTEWETNWTELWPIYTDVSYNAEK